jgi:hypothetical protein
MHIHMSKQELRALRSHLVKQLRYFHKHPSEWEFWNSTCNLDELNEVLKKVEKHLQKGN